jgi:NADH dehydrogenase
VSNVIVIKQANDIGPDLGPGPRPAIGAALEGLGVTVRPRTAGFTRTGGRRGIFATGDVAFAQLDDDGAHALMSCQHAMTMEKFAGYNVAADLILIATIPYQQPRYVTGLDLGAWGAVYVEGWDRQVKLVGEKAKALKRMVNTQWIYPPRADRAAALAAADPERAVAA